MSDRITSSANDEELLSFLYMCPVGLLRTAANGDVQMLNPEAAQLLLPLTKKPSLQNLFDTLESCAPELRGMAARFPDPSGSICDQHRIFVSSSGPGPRVVACSLLKINPDCLMAVLQDVTKQVEQERRLRQNEAVFAALVAGVNDFAIFSLDKDGNIDSWNLSAARQTGFRAEDVLGRHLGTLSLPAEARADDVAGQIADAVREGWSLRDRWFLRKDGGRYWCQVMVAADQEIDGAGEVPMTAGKEPDSATHPHSTIAGFAVVLRDVTEQHVTGEHLHRLLTTDYLTGAINRGRFFEVAELEVERHKRAGRPMVAMMLDVDHFKRVNDCFGHAAGDGVLKAIVEVCQSHLRKRDVLARLGGEEFAVLLPDTELLEAMAIADLICRSVPSAIALPAGACLNGLTWPAETVGISIGCAELNPSISGIDALLKAADTALFAAKHGGRGQARAVVEAGPAATPAIRS